MPACNATAAAHAWQQVVCEEFSRYRETRGTGEPPSHQQLEKKPSSFTSFFLLLVAKGHSMAWITKLEWAHTERGGSDRTCAGRGLWSTMKRTREPKWQSTRIWRSPCWNGREWRQELRREAIIKRRIDGRGRGLRNITYRSQKGHADAWIYGEGWQSLLTGDSGFSGVI